MRHIRLPSFPCLQKPEAVEALNRLLTVNRSLALSQVASATACPQPVAMALLLYLEGEGVIECRLLAFHTLDDIDPPVPFLVTRLKSGLPSLPLACTVCDRDILEPDELEFEYAFNVLNQVQLTL